MTDQLLKVRDVQRRLGVGKSWTYKLLADGALRAVRLTPGGTLRIRESDLDAYIAGLHANVKSERLVNPFLEDVPND